MDNNPAIWAINTIKATWFEMVKAKLLGKKITHTSDGVTVTAYKFEGRTYLVDFEVNDANN